MGILHLENFGAITYCLTILSKVIYLIIKVQPTFIQPICKYLSILITGMPRIFQEDSILLKIC